MSKKKFIIYIVQVISILFINFLSTYKMMGIKVAIVSSCLIFLCACILIKSNIVIKKKHILCQLIFIVALAYLFIHSAILSPLTSITHTLRAVACSIIISLSLIVLLFSVKYDVLKKWIIEYISKNKVLMLVLVFSVALRALQFNSVPIFDAEEYYSALVNGCMNFDFSIRSFINSFMLFNHPTIGYTFFLAIGQFTFYDSFLGIYLVNSILTLCALLFVYELLKHFFPELSSAVIALGTFFVSCLPTFLGTFSYVHMDYGITIFLVFSIYMYSTKRYILGSFFSLVLVLSKEVGIVLYAGYFCGIILYRFIKESGGFLLRIRNLLRQKEIWIAFIPILGALLWVLFILVGAISFWNPDNHNAASSSISLAIDASENSINVLGYNLHYIIYRLKQIFVFNTHWILTFFSVLGVIFLALLKKKRRQMTFLHTEEMIAMLMSFSFMTLFSVFYITYELMRYNIVLEFLLGIITISFMFEIIKSIRLKTVVVLLPTILFLLQSFISIDPVTNYLVQSLNTEKNDINFICENTTWPGDPLVYNYHYNYFNKVIDGILTNVQYDGETIYVLGNQQTLWPQGRFNTYLWDKHSRKRVHVAYANKNTTEINTIYGATFDEIAEEDQVKTEAALLIFLPIYEVDIEDALVEVHKKYYISDEKKIEIPFLGVAYYYTLNQKE